MSKTLETTFKTRFWNYSPSSSSRSPFTKHRLTMVKTHKGLKVICQNSLDKIPGDGGVIKQPESSGNTDVIIVGAGVAGASLAYALAKDGRRVHILERDLAEPNRIVGEVLHPGGYLKLIELGLEGKFHIHCVEGIEAQQVSGYAIYMNDKSTRLYYPLGKFPSNVCGKSFHNGRFIQRMRNKASSLPKYDSFCRVGH
ncbi:hypothetical protein L2E82_01897 [Cichorium intybus]|uniref:Uncharacterized protein n=1 Tax=Cichorium intybus TaxID=13427 RepID=A0ACB9H092_CICIN|nr:hypothetical protein L2E82_01897 [Cichorium intybus]